MAEFTYCPFLGANVTKTPRVRVAQFGDGYMQRVGDGINNTPRQWQLQFKGSQSYIEEVDLFLSTAGGADSFDWQPSTGADGKWICSSWSVSAGGKNNWSLSATFTEVYGE